MGDIRVAFGTKYGPIGIAGWVFGGIDLLVNVLHIPPVRRVLVMSELGQAIDFIVEHWTHPGWMGDPTTQIFVILACALVILWDGRRTHENSNAQQMITIGLVLIVLGAIAIGVGWWQLPSTSSSAVAVATPPPVQSEPSRPAIPKITYTERDIRELLDALSDADDLVSKKLMPVWSPLQNRLINPEYFLTQLGRKVTIQALNDSKDLLQKIVWPSINDFVYKEHNRYEAQMRIALALDQEAAKGELTRSLQSLIEKIELFPDDPDKIDVRAVGLVLPYYEKAKEHTQSFWNWLTLAQERTRAMQKNLREKGVTGFEAS